MKVLFICKGNWYRSQMAEEIYNHLTSSKDAFSVGTYTGADDEPEGQKLEDIFTHDYFFDVMNRNGFNVRKNITKKLLPEMLDTFDTIISMVEEPYIPQFLKENKKVIWWDVENRCDDRDITELNYDKVFNLVKSLITQKTAS